MLLATYAWLRLVMSACCLDYFAMCIHAVARGLGFALLWWVRLALIRLSSVSDMGGLTLVGIIGVSLRVVIRDS